jgi:hypothetical protein
MLRQEEKIVKNFRTLLAFLVILVAVWGCKFGVNSNNSNNSNSNNSNNSEENKNENKKTSNKNENSDDGGDIDKPDVSKIPIPSKKPETAPPSGGGGETITHTDARVQFTIPSGWSGKAAEDRYIVASPDDRLEVFFYVPSDGNFDKAVDDVVAEMNKHLQNLKVTEQAKKDTLNGMSRVSEYGTAVYQGTPVIWGLNAIKAPGNHLFVVTVADPKDFEGNKAGYSALIGSIKPK